jgi:hypothetical protein
LYRLNSKGQLAGWEALIIVILIGYAAYMTFLWAKKPSENSIYQSGSKPVITDYHMSPFSCVREGKLDAVSTNSQVARTK